MSNNVASELLERHAPILRYDRFEPYVATSVDALLRFGEGPASVARCELWRSGELYAWAGGSPSPAELLSTEPGGSYPDGVEWGAHDDLRVTGQGGPVDYRFHGALQQELHGRRLHGRVVRRPDGWWLQYWLFYFFNDRIDPQAGPFVHEGDWELVQVRVPPDAAQPDRPGSEPDAVTFSQHISAQRRSWRFVRKDGPRPVVFIGRGTHACYPGRSWLGSWALDIRDGAYVVGDTASLDVTAAPVFTRWPGRWGQGSESPGALKGRVAWEAPDVYHREAVGLLRGVLRAFPRLLRSAVTVFVRRGTRAVRKPVDVYREVRGTRARARSAGTPDADSRGWVRSVARRFPWRGSAERMAVAAGWEDAETIRLDVAIRDFGWSLAVAYLIVRLEPDGRPQRVYTWKVRGAVPGDGGFRFSEAVPWALDPAIAHRIEVRAAPASAVGQLRVGAVTLPPRTGASASEVAAAADLTGPAPRGQR